MGPSTRAPMPALACVLLFGRMHTRVLAHLLQCMVFGDIRRTQRFAGVHIRALERHSDERHTREAVAARHVLCSRGLGVDHSVLRRAPELCPAIHQHPQCHQRSCLRRLPPQQYAVENWHDKVCAGVPQGWRLVVWHQAPAKADIVVCSARECRVSAWTFALPRAMCVCVSRCVCVCVVCECPAFCTGLWVWCRSRTPSGAQPVNQATRMVPTSRSRTLFSRRWYVAMHDLTHARVHRLSCVGLLWLFRHPPPPPPPDVVSRLCAPGGDTVHWPGWTIRHDWERKRFPRDAHLSKRRRALETCQGARGCIWRACVRVQSE